MWREEPPEIYTIMTYRRFCNFVTLFSFVFISAGVSARPATDYVPLIKARGEGYDYYCRPHGPLLISDWDHVMREVSESEGHDWRLLSAIAYHESRFDAGVVSRRGACGLMQVMPRTARQFQVDTRSIMDPQTNVTVAARLLTSIERMLGIPKGVTEEDRLSLVLASYNGGIGHVADARRLARKYGGDPNNWDDVAAYLTSKSSYLEDDAVKYGRFTGRETLAFVDNVIGKYRSYCRRYPI